MLAPALVRSSATLAAALALACATVPRTPAAARGDGRRASPERPGWELVWHDEFDEPAVDRSRWTFDQGGLWYNGEQQFYTDRPQNARVEGGKLVLEARREQYFGSEFTSARLKTAGLASFRYGRIEARMRVPAGQGLWPAFWMLGEDFASAGWPGCGEIDIVEVIGREPGAAHATVHGTRFHGAGGITASYTLPRGALADAEHVYAVEWEPGSIRWYLDDVLYHTVTPKDLPVPSEWPFDKRFFLILNLAVGGTWPGAPDATTPFPARLEVDYVRVYRRPG
jgi:beta-glucanase (GH16 family)